MDTYWDMEPETTHEDERPLAANKLVGTPLAFGKLDTDLAHG